MQVIRSGLNFTIVPVVHKRTLIWIHGLGDTGEAFCNDFFSAPLLPDCKVVLPTAPVQPVTMYGESTTSWYDIKADYGYEASMESSVEIISAILQEESKHTDCIVLGGFSQGAVMSMYTGLSKYQGQISAIVALSGYAVCSDILPGKTELPVLWYHGGQDTLIPWTVAQESARRHLTRANITWKVDQTMGHEVLSEEYDFIRKWLNSILRI